MSGRKKLRDIALYTVIGISVVAVIAFLVWILGYIFLKGGPRLSGKFLSSLLPMIVSTLLMVVISLLLATPIGIFCAIYLTQYAKQGRLVTVIRFAIECLSGIPSIIYGLFGMVFFVVILQMGFSLLSGALTVAIMLLPTIIRTTEEAILAVPPSYAEGSLALGASRLRTIFCVILKSAKSGIISSIVLAIGRVVGETAAIYFTAGMVPRMPTHITDSGRTLAVHLYLLAKEGLSFQDAYATAAVLIVLVLLVNLITYALAGGGKSHES